ncbi:dihydroorotate dehydrogenase [Pelagibacterium lacus]|uniref:Dihydroorotate dehydrogenase n=1 Tax=Pelagibacterium lacus TaxID=2282655 RepID=A0A369W329_9HYPH|nr:dihydroorotate dehydrogenase [Pelagibacterium lacus]RDE08275.1 dihydroorotate dehydrogenase [Pelagibacterium lacus]
MVDLATDLGRGLVLANPVMPASGTFAEGLAKVVDLNAIGALVTKTITAELRGGNPVPRVSEVGNGMLNSIGIPSKGIDYFLAETLPFFRQFSSPLIVSVSAPSVEAFARAAERLNADGIAGIEANISCPNIEEDGKAFAMRPSTTEQAIAAMRRVTDLPLWAKLTPNTGDIAAVARAAEAAGADALVVANTILAMAIDIETMRPTLGNVMGGLSGPAIKPITLRMTYQCARAVSIPVIGCGGISTASDAVEYLLAGAGAVQVGTATFLRPHAMTEVIAGIAAYCERKGIARMADFAGALDTGMREPDVMEAAQ